MDRNDASDHAEPLKMHSHHDLDDAGTPRMTQAMLRVIAGPARDVLDAASDSERDELTDLDQQRKARALARLQAEHPQLYGIVYLVDHRGLSLRSVGRHLNLDHHTVGRHRDKGLAYVRDWCSDTRQAS